MADSGAGAHAARTAEPTHHREAHMRLNMIEMKYWTGKRAQRALMWAVWRLPRKVVMWSYIRVAAHATTGKYGNTVVPELTMMEALDRWDDK